MELIRKYKKIEIYNLIKEIKSLKNNHNFKELEKLQQKALIFYDNNEKNQFLKDAIILSYESIYKKILKKFKYKLRFVTYYDQLQECHLFATEALNNYNLKHPKKVKLPSYISNHVQKSLNKNHQNLNGNKSHQETVNKKEENDYKDQKKNSKTNSLHQNLKNSIKNHLVNQ